MKHSIIQMTREEYEDELTRAIKIYTQHIYEERYINEETAAKLLKTKVVIVRRPSKITNLWKKLFNMEEDSPRMMIGTIKDLGFYRRSTDGEQRASEKTRSFSTRSGQN